MAAPATTQKITRRRELKPDSKGYYRPYVGYKGLSQTGDPKETIGLALNPHRQQWRQHRFNLGTDKREAKRRYARIQELYAESCQVAENDEWTEFALYAAGLIAKGVYCIPFPFDRQWLDAMQDPAAEYAQLVELSRSRYPSLEIVPEDAALYESGRRRNKEYEIETVQHALRPVERVLKDLGIVGERTALPNQIVTGTLHEALDVFKRDEIDGVNVIPGTSTLKQYGHRRKERVDRLKGHQSDIPLFALNLDVLKAMVNHWRNRPPHKRTQKPTSKGNAETHLSELKRFFNWLDSTEKFQWMKPRGFESIHWTVQDDTTEKVPVHKHTYYPEQLALIAERLDDFGKMCLAVGLNCAMGAAELGRLTREDFLLNYQHEFQRKLKFKSTSEDSFCREFRPKTKIFGEWILWPETVKWVRWGIARAEKLGTNILFCDDDGRSLYVETAKNPQYKFANLWTDVTEKLKETDETFPKYPFGSLRDTLPDELRQTTDDELASLALAHGRRIGADKLIDCYTNRRFGKLHEAIREARRYFMPVLSVL